MPTRYNPTNDDIISLYVVAPMSAHEISEVFDIPPDDVQSVIDSYEMSGYPETYTWSFKAKTELTFWLIKKTRGLAETVTPSTLAANMAAHESYKAIRENMEGVTVRKD
ncbi:hypothetical protein [Plectonema phage JingP1]|uniref:Uncharacterized protein n=1 Tax=Plectonema phage JingP1 TaxID=2961687 RepID=A0A9E7NNG2_9CAUD|nr:hypothetical protein [Plectonema phage JingP1]